MHRPLESLAEGHGNADVTDVTGSKSCSGSRYFCCGLTVNTTFKELKFKVDSTVECLRPGRDFLVHPKPRRWIHRNVPRPRISCEKVWRLKPNGLLKYSAHCIIRRCGPTNSQAVLQVFSPFLPETRRRWNTSRFLILTAHFISGACWNHYISRSLRKLGLISHLIKGRTLQHSVPVGMD